MGGLLGVFATTTVAAIANHTVEHLFSPSGQQSASTVAASPTGPLASATQVRTFVPWDLGDSLSVPGAHISAIPAQGASCVPSPISSDPDAYRCFAGNAVYDPCWLNAARDRVACVPDPWSSAIMILSSPFTFDTSATHSPGRAPDPLGHPWAMQISDPERDGGQLDCSATPDGPLGEGGLRVNWQCFEPGHVDDTKALRGDALGDLLVGTGGFRAVRYRPADSASVQTVNVLIVWE